MRRLGAWFPGLLSDFLEVIEEHPPAKAGGCSNVRLEAYGFAVVWRLGVAPRGIPSLMHKS
jgi:hypothetical protein